MGTVNAEVGAYVVNHGDVDDFPGLTTLRTAREKRRTVAWAVLPLGFKLDMSIVSAYRLLHLTAPPLPHAGPRLATVRPRRSSFARRRSTNWLYPLGSDGAQSKHFVVRKLLASDLHIKIRRRKL